MDGARAQPFVPEDPQVYLEKILQICDTALACPTILRSDLMRIREAANYAAQSGC